jgi:hypothetical protein
LQCLLRLNPLFHRQPLLKPRLHICCLQLQRIINGNQHRIVVRPREVQHHNAMNLALEQATSQMRGGVCEVNRNCSRLSRYVRPVSVFAKNLQPSNRFAEKQRHSPEIDVSGTLAKATRPVLFRNPFTVDHVTEVIFAFFS